jgi:signal peptidase
MNAQVVAVAWRPGGSVLVLPAFGAVVDGIRDIVGGLQRAVASLVGASALLGPSGVWWLVAGFSAVLYLVVLFAPEEISRDSERRTDRESGRDARALLAGFALLLVAGATVAMVAPAGTTEYEIVSAEFESEQPTVVRAGNATTLTQPVRNTGIVPVRV